MTTAVLAAIRLLRRHESRLRRIGPPLLLLVAVGLTVLYGRAAINALLQTPALVPAMLATLFTAVATGAGALPVLFVGRVSARGESAMLGFGAGVMLAAAAFSLILPALDTATPWVVGAGIALGAAVMLGVDYALPHIHVSDGAAHRPGNLSGVWLIVLAIALHNIPEGLAVGVAHASGRTEGAAVTLGIAVQNLPEGLIVAWAVRSLGYSKTASALVALATGLVEPIGALIGVLLLSLSSMLLPWGLAFAAGAMLFVVSHEIIPASHQRGHESHATIGVTTGFVAMLILTAALS